MHGLIKSFFFFFLVDNWTEIDGKGDKTSVADNTRHIPVPILQWCDDKLAWLRSQARHPLSQFAARVSTVNAVM